MYSLNKNTGYFNLSESRLVLYGPACIPDAGLSIVAQPPDTRRIDHTIGIHAQQQALGLATIVSKYMKSLAKIVIGVIALLHIYICWFEMFAWTTRGPEVFSSFPLELFEPTKALAANQGLYNLFLAIGLIWSLIIKDSVWWKRVAWCFLIFVAIAGVVGSVTVGIRILLVQTVPAVIAIVLVYLSREKEPDTAS